MRLHRFYTTQKLTPELEYANTEHLHQWRSVFRYAQGDQIILFGDGYEHTYTINQIDKKSANLSEARIDKSLERDKKITLAVALIKKDNFELVLEKCTELGVSTFIPVISDRSVQKMYGAGRLEKILIEATEQSGWSSVPVLQEATFFDKLISDNRCVVFDSSGQTLEVSGLKNITAENIFCIGPEGGWSQSEIENLKEKNCTITALGPNTLRAETAAITVCGLISL